MPDIPQVTADDEQAAAPLRQLEDKKIPYDVLRFVPQESAEHYRLAPLAVNDGVLEVGMVDPTDLAGIDALNFIAKSTGLPFKVFQITPIDFDTILKMYKGLGGEVDHHVDQMGNSCAGRGQLIGCRVVRPVDDERLADAVFTRHEAPVAGVQ